MEFNLHNILFGVFLNKIPNTIHDYEQSTIFSESFQLLPKNKLIRITNLVDACVQDIQRILREE